MLQHRATERFPQRGRAGRRAAPRCWHSVASSPSSCC